MLIETLIKRSFRKIASGVAAMALLMATATNAVAVTDAEMDHARAIAAKFYIRYVNDGAGYLDNWLPGSMAELEKKLSNSKDKQNFKQFKSAAMPSDYSSWDKAKLVDYWSGTFFSDNASKLDAKGAGNGMCKKQIKKAVEGIAVAAPSAAASAPADEPPAPSAADLAADSAQLALEEAAMGDNLAEAEAEIEDQQAAAQEELQDNKASSGSGTWVYIMVLAILVVVVIFLVIYASRTMKGQKRTPREEDHSYEETPENDHPQAPAEEVPAPSFAGDARMREKYAEALAGKAEEIRVLTRQLGEMEALAAGLKEENRQLKAELNRLRATAHSPRHEEETRYSPTASADRAESRQAPEGEPKEVYLGRVNSRGIFVRADRHAVDGQSIYKLTTTNGVTGTYALINNPLIEEQVLEDPGKWLAGGCFAKDIFDTEGREGIHTETHGTAIFKDGAWRVEKKSRIRYV